MKAMKFIKHPNFLKYGASRTVALALAAFLLGSGASAVVSAANNDGESASESTTTTAQTQTEAEKTDYAVDKDETVYVIANSDGSVKKIIVSDWIKNNTKSAQLTDVNEPKNVKDVKGEQSYTIDENNMRVWDAQSGDIYSQGEGTKALPVNISISYSLDGTAVSPDELAGKSGRVTMRFDYTNAQYEYVEIDGKKEKIYVPFVMLTGMLLDNEVFSDISVTNGRLINDGERTAVIGLAMPGLQENLAISNEDFEIPSYVEISAQVTDFALTTTLSIATNDIFNSVDLDEVDSFDKLKTSMAQLTDGLDKLLDGSSELYGGLNTLLAKSDELIAGVDKLAEGAKALKGGTAELSSGAKKLADGAGSLADGADKAATGANGLASGVNTIFDGAAALSSGTDTLYGGAGQLLEGMKSLSGGLQEISSNNEALTTGAKQVFDTLLTTVSTQIADNGITVDALTTDNYSTVLNSMITNPTDVQKAQLIKIASAQLDSQLTAVPEDYRNSVKVILYDKVSKGETLDKAITDITSLLTDAATVQTVSASESIQPDTVVYTALVGKGYDNTTAGLTAKLCAYLAYINGGEATAYVETAASMLKNAQTLASAAADKDASTKIDTLCLMLAQQTLAQTVETAVAQLDKYNEFYQGIISYTNGVTNASAGAGKLEAGASELADGAAKAASGASELANGASSAASGAGELASGVSSLADGADKLENGANELSSGAVKAANGASELSNGLDTLKNSTPALKDGVTRLADGAMQLSEGLQKFKKDGIDKLSDVVNKDLNGIVTRLKATVDVSKDYKTYTGTADNMGGSVKFIYRTESIGE